MIRSLRHPLALPLGAALLASLPGLANAGAANDTDSAAAPPNPAACLKTVSAIGASMGAAEAKAGGTTLHFVVRHNGIDYDVVCDPVTGVVSDVSKRAEPLPN